MTASAAAPANFNVGDLVAEFLSLCKVKAGFGIISVHNIPILDAISRKGGIRFVTTRGEMGAAHMADSYARVTGELGLIVSSTGPGAANAVSGLVEARFASTPLLHITGQVPSHLIGRDTGTTHDVADQIGMLKTVCKAAFHIHTPEEAWGVLMRAATEALTAPFGPVSIEIPIDVQKKPAPRPPVDATGFHLPIPALLQPSQPAMDALVEQVLKAKRPMLWVGNGARNCRDELLALLDEGFGMASSWAGRGIVPEDHPMTIAGLNGTGSQVVQNFYESVDLLIVVGSRLRGQETVDSSLPLPKNRIHVDIDPKANGRTYTSNLFVLGDSKLVLAELLKRVKGKVNVGSEYKAEFADMKQRARKEFAGTLGHYHTFPEQLRAALPRDTLWVRDITIANSTWGNRLFELYNPRDGVHPVGAGIGQGFPLGIGAAVAAGNRKTVVLNGDAGFMMNVSELWTAIQEKLNMLIIVMNDAGYGVIRHMQDSAFGGRRVYGELLPPDFKKFAEAADAYYEKVTDASKFGEAAVRAIKTDGISIVEVDMVTIGEAPPYFPWDGKK